MNIKAVFLFVMINVISSAAWGAAGKEVQCQQQSVTTSVFLNANIVDEINNDTKLSCGALSVLQIVSNYVKQSEIAIESALLKKNAGMISTRDYETQSSRLQDIINNANKILFGNGTEYNKGLVGLVNKMSAMSIEKLNDAKSPTLKKMYYCGGESVSKALAHFKIDTTVVDTCASYQFTDAVIDQEIRDRK